MKKLISIFLIIIFSQITFSQESECQNFRVGKFIYKSEGLPDIIITRTETEQFEIVQNSNEEIKGKVFWMSDCSYKFTFTKSPIQNLIGKTMYVELYDPKNKFAKGKASFEETIFNFSIEKIE